VSSTSLGASHASICCVAFPTAPSTLDICASSLVRQPHPLLNCTTGPSSSAASKSVVVAKPASVSTLLCLARLNAILFCPFIPLRFRIPVVASTSFSALASLLARACAPSPLRSLRCYNNPSHPSRCCFQLSQPLRPCFPSPSSSRLSLFPPLPSLLFTPSLLLFAET
jgi:hypothetical protein